MLNPEQYARQLVDDQLTTASWLVQDYKQLNLGAAAGIAVREHPTTCGPADYALLIDRRLVGMVQAKKEGTSLTAVAEQTACYRSSATKHAQHVVDELPFGYEANEQKTALLARRSSAGWWLAMMKYKVVTSLRVEAEDFTLPPFVDQGGGARARQVFGANLQALVDEWNEALAP